MLHRCFRCFDNIYDHQFSSYCCYPALLPKCLYFLHIFWNSRRFFSRGEWCFGHFSEFCYVILWHFGPFCWSFEAHILKFKGPGLQLVYNEDVFIIFLTTFLQFLGHLFTFCHSDHLTDQIVDDGIFIHVSCFWLLVRPLVLLRIMLWGLK